MTAVPGQQPDGGARVDDEKIAAAVEDLRDEGHRMDGLCRLTALIEYLCRLGVQVRIETSAPKRRPPRAAAAGARERS